jgi:hypothetical protein
MCHMYLLDFINLSIESYTNAVQKQPNKRTYTINMKHLINAIFNFYFKHEEKNHCFQFRNPDEQCHI